jgi:RNA polymerase sporulation-specific sigma factor
MKISEAIEEAALAYRNDKNEQNFEKLIQILEPYIDRFTHKFAYLKQNNEDLKQELLLRLWKWFDRWDPNRKPYAFFANLIMSRYCMNRYYHEKNRKIKLNEINLIDFDIDEDAGLYIDKEKMPDQQILDMEENKDTKQIIDTFLKNLFSKKEYEIFILKADGYSLQETANILKINEKSVDNALERIKMKLKIFKDKNGPFDKNSDLKKLLKNYNINNITLENSIEGIDHETIELKNKNGKIYPIKLNKKDIPNVLNRKWVFCGDYYDLIKTKWSFDKTNQQKYISLPRYIWFLNTGMIVKEKKRLFKKNGIDNDLRFDNLRYGSIKSKIYYE